MVKLMENKDRGEILKTMREKWHLTHQENCGYDCRFSVRTTEAIGSSITFFIYLKKDSDSEVCPVKIFFRSEEKAEDIPRWRRTQHFSTADLP